MTRHTLVPLATALTALYGFQRASAQAPAAKQTVPVQYAQGFEEGPDPVVFWTSYKKKCTVNFKGVTDEKAHSGKRSLKLDVTFDQTSRFLWRIPLAKKVPASGELEFSGRLFVDEASSAAATLGVSFALPPTKHTGCTAWGGLYPSTGGKWQRLRDDLVARGREKAGVIVGRQNWGVKGKHVGALVESITIDVRAQIGQRVVLYVDDLEIKGQVPSAAAFRDEVKKRWASRGAEVEEKVASWRVALRDAEKTLASLTSLSPRAEGMRREMMGKIEGMKAMAVIALEKGGIRKKDQSDIDTFLAHMDSVPVNIKAVSGAERVGQHALVYVVRPISDLMILPDDKYVPGRAARALSLTAARGEYEPASFVVSAMSAIDSLTLTVSDLRSDGATIPADRVDVKAVKCWYQAGTAWVTNRQDKSRSVLIPELLLNDDTLIKVDDEKKGNYIKLRFPEGERYEWISDPTDIKRSKSMPVDKFPVKDSPVLLPVNIPAGKNKQFWLTVHAPMDAKPGTYTGTIALNTPKAALGDLSLTVTVLPFELLPPYYTSSMDYHGRLNLKGKGTISSWSKSRKQFRSELANMVAHGLRNCQHYSIRKEILGEVLKIRAEVGMDNRTLYLKKTIPIGNPMDSKALETIKRDVRDIIEFTTGYGTEAVYFYGMDEQRGDVLRSQRPAWTAVREAGGKIFVAGYSENVDTMGDVQDMHVRAGRPNKEEVAKWHALGHKIFCYANPQVGVENPVVYRRNYGLLLWQYDYDGASTNAYQHTFGMTWNDFDHVVYRAHTIAYPTVDGVVDTIAWEGYREGVDDVRYVTTLQNAIEEARKSKDRARNRSADAAQVFLRGLKARQSLEAGDLDSLRREIVAHILELTRAAAGE